MASTETTRFGELLRRHRLVAGLTQQDLAERAALSVRGLSYLEKGARRPYRDTVRRLATALALPPTECRAFEDAARRHDGVGSVDQELPSTAMAVARPRRCPGQDGAMPQVYVSYAQADRHIVERLIGDLERWSLTVWSEDQGLPPGTPSWEQALRDAIRAAPLVLAVVSPVTRASHYVADELRVAELYQRPVCPIWVAGEEWMECIPLGWGGMQYLDARGERYVAALPRLVAVARDAERAAADQMAHDGATAALPVALRNPYKGLRAFGERDAGDFFGRDALVDDLVERVWATMAPAATRFLAVVGPSGSGKSSAVLAGLLPRLRAGVVSGSAQWVYLDVLTPGPHPLTALAAVLHTALPASSRQELSIQLTASADGLHRVARRLVAPVGDEARVVLLVDQAEELFTLATDEAERRQVIDLLVAAATEPGGPLLVLLTLRADFYDRPMSERRLGRLVAEHHVAVLPMSIAEMRTAIEGPALLPDVGLRFEGEVVGDLLYEVQGQPGALPLLQFTLDQLVAQRSGRLVTEAAYRALGGVRGALARQAEAMYTGLPDEGYRTLARVLFLRLIEPGTSAQQATRRRAPLSELDLVEAAQTARMRTVVETFIAARLLTALDRAGMTMLEVSHEALIREWGRLSIWVEEAREDVRLQGRISVDAAEWEQHGRPTDSLYRGTVLAEAQDWAERNMPSAGESAFLAEAKGAEQRQAEAERDRQARELALTRRAATRLRALVGVLAIFLLAAAGLSALVLANARQAQHNAHLALLAQQHALTERNVALSRQMASQSVTHLNDRYDLALLLGLQANHIANTPQSRGALLQGLAAAPTHLIAFLRTSDFAVNSVALSPDGTVLASGSEDGTVRLWDLRRHRPLSPPLVGHTGAVSQVFFTPDGKAVISSGVDRTIRLWSVARQREDGAPLATDVNSLGVGDMTLSPNGKLLARVRYSETRTEIIVWDVKHRTQVEDISIPSIVSSIAFSPDGKTLAYAGTDPDVTLWDVASNWVSRGINVQSVIGMAFSPVGHLLAIATRDNRIRFWDTARERFVGASLASASAIGSMAFSADGKTLATGDRDGRARVWDVLHRQLIGPPLVSHTGTADGVSLNRDGSLLAVATGDGTIALWDVTGRPAQPPSTHAPQSGVSNVALRVPESGVSSVAFSPDGILLAVGSYDQTTRLWDLRRRQQLGAPLGQDQVRHDCSANCVWPIAFSPDGKYVASGGSNGLIHVWTVAHHQLVATLDAALNGGKWVDSLAFSPRGKVLAAGNGDGGINLYDTAHWTPIGVPLTGHTDQITSVAFSPNGRILASSSYDHTIRLWDVARHRLLGLPLREHTDAVLDVAFSPNGKSVASTSGDATVRLWDVVRQRPLNPPLVETDPAAALAFSPDGTILATGGPQRIWLWDVASHQPLSAPLGGHTGEVSSLAFSADGMLLASGSVDHTVRLWDMNVADWQRLACHIANRNLTHQEWTQYLGDLPYRKTCPGLPAGV